METQIERTRPRGDQALLAGCALSWFLVIVVEYQWLWLATELWLLALGVRAAVWLPAIVLTLLWVAARARRRASIVPVLILVVVAIGAWFTPWPRIHAQTDFWLHGTQFVTVAALVDGGRLRSTEYYGAPLPGSLGGLSVTGSISHTDARPGTAIRGFVPSFAGIPDGAVGFGYYPDGLGGGESVDGYGDPIRPCWSAGGGWWWMESGCRK